MKKIYLMAVLLAAISTAQAQYSSGNQVRRYDEQEVYTDERGEYHWQVIERQVWIPEQRVRGIFGSRTIPGHYETRTDRQRIYHREQGRNGKKAHPHGMPPGQRKKMNSRYDDRGVYNDQRYQNNYPYDDNRNDKNGRSNKRRD